jgi:TRAP-type uncharacterized transport system substrate-binding protein
MFGLWEMALPRITKLLERILNNRKLTLLAGLGLLVVAVVLLFRVLGPPTYETTLIGGKTSGTDYILAQRYLVPDALKVGLRVRLVSAPGSEDNLDTVNAGRADFAFVDGGLGAQGRANVREVAPLQITALHLVVKPAVYDQAMTMGLKKALQGKRMDLSQKGSGTYTFSMRVLTMLGLGENDFVSVPDVVSAVLAGGQRRTSCPMFFLTWRSRRLRR